LRYTLK
jgi:hypothetical protein